MTRFNTDNNNNQGNVTMDLAVNNTHIGQSFVNDLTLHPGDNTVSMTSKVDKMAVVRNLPADGMLPVVIRGNSSVYRTRVGVFQRGVEGEYVACAVGCYESVSVVFPFSPSLPSFYLLFTLSYIGYTLYIVLLIMP